MASLEGALASVPGLAGYVAKDQINRQREGQEIARAIQFQTMEKHAQDQQERARQIGLEKQRLAEIEALPPDQRTPENFARIGAKYAPAKDLYHYSQQSLDTRERVRANNEVALARLRQAAQIATQNYNLRVRNLERQEDKDAAGRQLQDYLASLKAEALKYNTGVQMPDFEFQLPARGASGGGGGGVLPPHVPASDAAAYRAVAEARGPASVTVDRQVTPEEEARMVQMPDAAPGQSAGTPVQMPQAAAPDRSVPMPDAANLDARDLQARAAAGAQPAPVTPAPSVASPTAAPAAPQMPKFTGSPREVQRAQNAWLAKNAANSGAASLSPDALKVAAWEKLLFGTDPKGLGTASAQQRAQVADERARIGKALGLSEQEMAMMPQDNKVKMKAVDKLTTWDAFVGKASEQLEKSVDLAIEYAKRMDPTTIQALNKAIIAGRKQFNDPIANAYAMQVNTIRTEYGRLMTGPTSNAMLPVEAIKKSDDMISQALDVPAWAEMKKVLVRDAQITREAVRNQITGLRSSITGRTPPGGEPAEPKPSKPLSEMTNAELKEYRDKLRARSGR